MPTVNEYNQFRRLIGDYGKNEINNTEIDSYLNDATLELTADFVDSLAVSAPVDDIDDLVAQYHPEVIYKAAINFWWDRAAKYSTQLSTSTGQAANQASERWDRAMEMIRMLEEKFQGIQTLGTDITMGNISRFSKLTLTRIGGVREETARDNG